MKVEFTVNGNPVGKGRPIFSRYGGGVHTRTPEKTVIYENLVRMEYERQCDYHFPDTALSVEIHAYYSIPKSASRKRQEEMLSGAIRPTKRPDADNLCKAILDSLNGYAYHDDAQVVDCKIHKYYADKPRAHIIIKTIGGIEE